MHQRGKQPQAVNGDRPVEASGEQETTTTLEERIAILVLVVARFLAMEEASVRFGYVTLIEEYSEGSLVFN